MILKDIDTPNGLAKFHVLAGILGQRPFSTITLQVNCYVNEKTFLGGGNLMYQYRVGMPADEVAGDLCAYAERWLTSDASSVFQGGQIVSDKTDDIETLRERKRAEITLDRIAADTGSFSYQGKSIRTADKDVRDLLVADARWSKGIPTNWPGGWLAMDNTMLEIYTKDEWDAFFLAMYDVSINNFKRAQLLKGQLEGATTAEEIAMIRWSV